MPRFLPVLVDGRAPTGHDEGVLTIPNPIKRCEVLCHDEIVKMASKKQGTSASAGFVRRSQRRRRAALLTLSKQQDLSGCHKIL